MCFGLADSSSRWLLEYIESSVINEQYGYKFELGNQSRTDATRFRMLTKEVHCTYKYMQLSR